LHVAEITVVFGGLTALDAVSLEVGVRAVDGSGTPSGAPGEVVGVIGPNGAGKTTLFNVISGFVRPTSGHLRLGDRELRHHRPHDLPDLGIARTLQGVGLWSGMTAVENVMTGATRRARSGLLSGLLGLPRSSRDERTLRDKAMAALDLLHVAEWADRYPPALPYPIQKRVSLARALACEPTLLLLDEPASGLSESEMDDLGGLIRSLRQHVDILLVEHHMDLVMSVCDRIVVLDFGRLLATGTPEEIKADPRVTEAYLGDVVEVGAAASFEGSPPADADAGA
jgi:branched-chain amino acid transport system ATP-binding protein